MRQPGPRLPLEQAGVGQPSLPRASLHTGLARNTWGPAQPRGPEAQPSHEGLRLRGTACPGQLQAGGIARSLDLPGLGLHGAGPPPAPYT